MKSNITKITGAIEKLLLGWSKNPDSQEIVEIEKATSALKRLQEIEHAENERQPLQTVVTHYIPRGISGTEAGERESETEA